VIIFTFKNPTEGLVSIGYVSAKTSLDQSHQMVLY